MLRHNTPVLPCGPDALQFGLDHRWALRLGGLAKPEISWLQEAAKWHRAPELTARKYQISARRAKEIIDTLLKADLLLPPLAPPGQTENASNFVEGISAPNVAAELPALSALRPDGAGRKTLLTRARRSVAITSGCRIGANTALLLATAGIGRLILTDENRVQEEDLGPYRTGDVGATRFEALRALIGGIAPRVEVVPDGTADFWISIESGTQISTYFGALLAENLPHLSIATQEAAAEVGPLVIPNRTACAHCLHLTRAHTDPAWPELVGEISRRPRIAAETVVAAAAAALAAAQTLSYLDGGHPALLNAIATVPAPDAIPRLLPFSPHPDCGCTNPADI
jgi:bacteriocin biosynthesis cyclodehydratase domain-containing protein